MTTNEFKELMKEKLTDLANALPELDGFNGELALSSYIVFNAESDETREKRPEIYISGDVYDARLIEEYEKQDQPVPRIVNYLRLH